MNKFNEILVKAQCKKVNTMTEEDPKKRGNMRKYVCIGVMVVMVMTVILALSCTAFAAGSSDTIADGIADGMDSLYKQLRMVAIPIAGVSVGFAGFQFFFGGEKGMEKAKKSILYGAIGVAIVLLAPIIMKTVASWFSSVESGISVFRD